MKDNYSLLDYIIDYVGPERQTLYWFLVDTQDYFHNLWWNKWRIPEKFGVDYAARAGLLEKDYDYDIL
tara:strand:+ start:581 stop:784 length:204 start_codon:yes stop_codon:yes gene_type:complete